MLGDGGGRDDARGEGDREGVIDGRMRSVEFPSRGDFFLVYYDK